MLRWGFFPPLKTSIRTTALLAVESRPLSGAKARPVGPVRSQPARIQSLSLRVQREFSPKSSKKEQRKNSVKRISTLFLAAGSERCCCSCCSPASSAPSPQGGPEVSPVSMHFSLLLFVGVYQMLGLYNGALNSDPHICVKKSLGLQGSMPGEFLPHVPLSSRLSVQSSTDLCCRPTFLERNRSWSACGKEF